MIKSMLTTMSVTAACGIMACAPARTQPETTSDLSLIQSRLAASEEKVEQLSQQITLIQMMVDSHQRSLQDLENAGSVPPAAEETSTTPRASSALPRTEETPLSADPDPAHREMTPAPSIPEAPVPAEPASVSLDEETAPPTPTAENSLIVDSSNPEYLKAMEVFRSGDYESAASLFEAFAEAFAKDDLADNALYWAGECKYTKKKFTEAIKRFKRVVEEYPSGSKVPDALLKIGFAYISLGDRDSAETYLKQVVTRYPFSSAGAKAEERLKTLRQ